MDNMLMKYENEKWYQIDILIEWGKEEDKDRGEKQKVHTFINGKHISTEKFFSIEPYGS